MVVSATVNTDGNLCDIPVIAASPPGVGWNRRVSSRPKDGGSPPRCEMVWPFGHLSRSSSRFRHGRKADDPENAGTARADVKGADPLVAQPRPRSEPPRHRCLPSEARHCSRPLLQAVQAVRPVHLLPSCSGKVRKIQKRVKGVDGVDVVDRCRLRRYQRDTSMARPGRTRRRVLRSRAPPPEQDGGLLRDRRVPRGDHRDLSLYVLPHRANMTHS